MKRLCEAIERDKLVDEVSAVNNDNPDNLRDSGKDSDNSNKSLKLKANKLNEVEADVWKITKNKRAPLKTKNVDGTIVDLSMSSKTASSKSFDEKLLDFLVEKKQDEENSETEIYGQIMNYVFNMKKDEISLLVDSKCNLEDSGIQKDLALVQSLGLSTVVTVYCHPRGKFQ